MPLIRTVIDFSCWKVNTLYGEYIVPPASSLPACCTTAQHASKQATSSATLLLPDNHAEALLPCSLPVLHKTSSLLSSLFFFLFLSFTPLLTSISRQHYATYLSPPPRRPSILPTANMKLTIPLMATMAAAVSGESPSRLLTCH